MYILKVTGLASHKENYGIRVVFMQYLLPLRTK